MTSQIYFRVSSEFKALFMGVIKGRRLTIEDVLRPYVEEYLKNPNILERLKASDEVGRVTRLSEQEREVIAFMRTAGKSTGSKGEMEISLVKDIVKWIHLIKKSKFDG